MNLLFEDDWSGLADARERRKRQNRLNQRARRLRQQENQAFRSQLLGQVYARTLHEAETFVSNQTLSSQPTASSVLVLPTCTMTSDWDGVHDGMHANHSYIIRPSLTPSAESITALTAASPHDRIRMAMIRHLAAFHRSYINGIPMADHLLSLTRMNVHRAFVSNLILLGLDWNWMQEESISPFTMERPGFIEQDLPITLRPTHIQRTQAHHTWLDLFPSPQMRDNLIRAGEDWDDEELCTDILGFWEGFSTGPAGLLLWGEPSNPANWEVTEGFLAKWGWIVRGCQEILLSTNSWRLRRGERPLFAINH